MKLCPVRTNSQLWMYNETNACAEAPTAVCKDTAAPTGSAVGADLATLRSASHRARVADFLSTDDDPIFAVVGASSKRWRPANHVLRCLLQHSKPALPVHPSEASVEGVVRRPRGRARIRAVTVARQLRSFAKHLVCAATTLRCPPAPSPVRLPTRHPSPSAQARAPAPS